MVSVVSDLLLNKAHSPIYCTMPNVKVLSSSYNASGGLKGSVRNLAVTNLDTGKYSAKLKNLLCVKTNSTDLNDGNFVTDYSKVIAVEAWIQYSSLGESGVNSADLRAVNTYISESDKIFIYTIDSTGAPANIIDGDSLNLVVYFTNSVGTFSSSLDNKNSIMHSTINAAESFITPFFIDLTTPSAPALVSAPIGSTVSLVSGNRYQVVVALKSARVSGIRSTMRVLPTALCDSVLAFTQPSYSDDGIVFDVEFFALDGGAVDTDYTGIDIVLETFRGGLD